MDLRALVASDEADVRELMGRCLDRDGGLPMATEPKMLRQLFFEGEGVCAESAGGGLVAVGALGSPTAGDREFMGVVDPGHRGQGLGTSLLSWAADEAGTGLVVRSESLSDAAVQLFSRLGFHSVLEEVVMRRSMTTLPPEGRFEEYQTWTSRSARLFFEAYVASFESRPGFPGWPLDRWVRRVTNDDDFSAESSIVVLSSGSPVGFLLVAGAWIDQLGVVPASRRRGIGSELVCFALHRISEAGAEAAWLNVGANNPRAASLYRRLGFEDYGRRGRFRRPG